jgi:flagella basal body P-ring formation protein FlgA
MNPKVVLIFLLCAVAFSAFAQTPPNDMSTDVDVPVPAHDIARGSVIAEGDLTYQTITATRAGGGVLRAITAVAGKEARRALRAGELIRPTDLKRPTVIAKGSTVTMVFEAPGMKLTTIGRALTEGGQGESITVLNPASYRQVEATVIGAGTVRVGASSTNGKALADEVAAAQR